jgi:septum formation protein
VLTGVALRTPQSQQWGAVVSTRVSMREYADREIEDYVGRGEPFDKAGGYAIQDTAFRPVEDLDGCYLNVVGLPLCAVAAGLRTLGWRVDGSADAVPPCGYCRRGADVVSIRSG